MKDIVINNELDNYVLQLLILLYLFDADEKMIA